MHYQGQTALNIQQLLEDAKAVPNAVIKEEQQALYIEINSEKTLFWFTQPEHPAHPAVIIRRVMEENGKIKLKTKGYTTGDKTRFERWLAQVTQQDQQVVKDVT